MIFFKHDHQTTGNLQQELQHKNNTSPQKYVYPRAFRWQKTWAKEQGKKKTLSLSSFSGHTISPCSLLQKADVP
jgi:hypothetical protein